MGRFRTRAPPFLCLFLIFLYLSCNFLCTLQEQQQPIKTIVVLVLENRSFDHMLGWMKNSVNPKINGVTGDECNPVSTNAGSTGRICFSDDAEFVDPDPGHSFEEVLQQGFPGNDDHPSHDVANGQRLVKEVYETLRASPQWNETLLVITYDEHGGFYDHVLTPYVNVPNPDGNTGPPPFFFNFDRLGVRVPTIMVSPWIKKGIVISRPNGPTPDSEFEHSSVPATIKKIFKLSSNYLTHRDAWAGTFEQVVGELTSPRTDCPEVLPDVAPLRSTDADENRGLSQFQGELVQLAAVLNGDHYLSSFPDEIGERMNVREAYEYVKGAVSRFVRASKEAIKLGADESAIVDMRSSLTTRSSTHN